MAPSPGECNLKRLLDFLELDPIVAGERFSMQEVSDQNLHWYSVWKRLACESFMPMNALVTDADCLKYDVVRILYWSHVAHVGTALIVNSHPESP